MPGTRVTSTDPDTGDTETVVIENDYVVVCDGNKSLNIGRFWDRHPQARRIVEGGNPHAEPTVTVVDGTSIINIPDGATLDAVTAAHAVAFLTHRAHLVGAVPNFDADVLDRLLRGAGLSPTFHYHLVDVETLAVGWLAARGEVPSLPWRSDDVTALGAALACHGLDARQVDGYAVSDVDEDGERGASRRSSSRHTAPDDPTCPARSGSTRLATTSGTRHSGTRGGSRVSTTVILSSGQRFPVGLRGPDGKPMTGDEFFSHVADVYAKGDR